MTGILEESLAVGDVLRQRYEILGLLGQGGFGVVYKARQVATGQSVAIKVLRGADTDAPAVVANRLARFEREMQICAHMHHPNIVRLMDSGRTDSGGVYSVFEFVPGKNLAEVLEEEGRLDPDEARHLMMQVVDALACAHAAGVIHRDLKPANIMIVPTGIRRNALVLDFGIGGLSEEARRNSGARLTLTNEAVGTPAYAAPEQLRNQPPTPVTDFYAWGLVFLECLTGQRAVQGGTVAEVIASQLSDDAVPLPEALVGHPLGELLRRVTSKDPRRRDVSAAQLLRELEACTLGGLSARAASLRFLDAPADAATATVSISAEPRAPRLVEGERRQITAVCCTLTAVALDDTEADVLALDGAVLEQQEACADIARRLDGHMAGALGDSVLFYFGYPSAREDDAQRAARAALAIVAEVRQSSAALLAEHRIRVDLRIGVHTGLVVLRDGAAAPDGRIPLVVGTTANLATRLSALAEPGTILVSDSTQRLLRKGFVLEEFGRAITDDTAQSVVVFVLRGGAPSIVVRDVPLVGREREMETILHAFRRAAAGAGQTVLVGGEPGIGKSRLVREVGECVSAERHTWLECRATPDSANTAFAPISDLLDRQLDPRRELDPRAKVSKLEALLGRHGFEFAEAMPLFTSLLSLPLPQRWVPLAGSPEKIRELTREAILSLLFEMAEKDPVVLLVEDLHWADPSTLELLTQMVGEVGPTRMLSIFTARPEFQAPWASGAVIHLQLSRLGATEVQNLVEKITGQRAVPSEVLAAIAARTDGVPLFVEELLLTMIETGALMDREGRYELTRPFSEVVIPATLRDLLVARLDRLGRARETAQVASAIGREFAFDLLRAVSPLGEQAAQEDLDKLVTVGLLSRRRRLKNPAYTFKHALVRDAAYESMLKRSRVDVHARIAAALEEGFPDVVKERPEVLAYQHAGAEQYEPALGYGLRSMQKAVSGSNNQEAIALSETLLTYVSKRPVEVRAALELSVNGLLTPALMATRGWGDDRVKQSVERSRQLLGQLGECEHRFPTLCSLTFYHHIASNRADARSTARELLETAGSLRDVGAEVLARTLFGECRWIDGDYVEAEKYLQSAVELYDPQAHNHHGLSLGLDTRVWAAASLGQVCWFTSGPRVAREWIRKALAWAEELHFVPTLGIAHLYDALVCQYARDKAGADAASTKAIALADQYGLPAIDGYCRFLQFWARDDGESGEPILAVMEHMGCRLGLDYYASLAAQTWMDRGEYARALARIEASIARCAEMDQYYYAPELHLRAATCRLRLGGNDDAARTSLVTAQRMARTQGMVRTELDALAQEACHFDVSIAQRERLAELQKALPDVIDR